MKKALFCIATIGSSLICSPVFSQEKQVPDSLGLPGDNLNLYAVLELFQKSETLEGFEKSLNAEDSKTNNLDLNGNNKIDYISVVDNVKGTAHAIVLQVAVSEKEKQDVAVIEVEKDDDGTVRIQVVGDEDLYGKNYIIEPKEETKKSASASTPNPGYKGTTTVNNTTNNYYNNNNANDYYYPASSWSIVRYMYYPTYVVYASPWYWGYYPSYWSPWSPIFWHSYYYGYHYPRYNHYCGWYNRSYNYRNNNAHSYYGQRRSTSTTVSQRRQSGEFKNTYSRPDLATREMRNDSHSNSRPSNSNVRGGSPSKETPHNRSGNEKTAPSRGNKVDRSNGGSKHSPSVKQNRSSGQSASPAPRSSSGPKSSGGGSNRNVGGGSRNGGGSSSGGSHGGGGNHGGGGKGR
ncbi:MAG: hypothetical protein V4608_01005 [Bacteroidota bacterium]